jgi:hypothetical protein
VTFEDPWNPDIFTVGSWRLWLGIVAGVSALAAVSIYAVSEVVRRREEPEPVPAHAE